MFKLSSPTSLSPGRRALATSKMFLLSSRYSSSVIASCGASHSGPFTMSQHVSIALRFILDIISALISMSLSCVSLSRLEMAANRLADRSMQSRLH
jgi:hypothetical protein